MIVLCVAATLIGTAAIIIIGVRTNALRNGTWRGDARPAYEPARCVVAWWLFLAITGYAFLPIIAPRFESFDAPIGGIAALELVTAFIVWLAGASGGPTRGFLRDLGSDRGEIALHAVQFVAWNALVGVTLALTTMRKGEVPTIRWTLPALLSVSAGYYIIFRTSRLGAAGSSSNSTAS